MLEQSSVAKMFANQLEEEALSHPDEITAEWLNHKLDQFAERFNLDESEVKVIELLFRKNIEVVIDRDISILDTDEQRVEWLTEERRADNDQYYWTRFSRNFKSKNIPKNIFDRTNKDTDKILTSSHPKTLKPLKNKNYF